MVIFGGIFLPQWPVIEGIFHSIGMQKTPLYLLVVACIMNIVLVSQEWVEGAGYALIVSQIFSAVPVWCIFEYQC